MNRQLLIHLKQTQTLRTLILSILLLLVLAQTAHAAAPASLPAVQVGRAAVVPAKLPVAESGTQAEWPAVHPATVCSRTLRPSVPPHSLTVESVPHAVYAIIGYGLCQWDAAGYEEFILRRVRDVFFPRH